MATVGDEIVCVVQKARPISATASTSATALKIRRGDVRRAVVVRTKKEVIRPDGRKIRFDDNAAVLINNKKELLATRINGVVSADLRMKGWGKIASIAPKVCHPCGHVGRDAEPGATGNMILVYHAYFEPSVSYWIVVSCQNLLVAHLEISVQLR